MSIRSPRSSWSLPLFLSLAVIVGAAPASKTPAAAADAGKPRTHTLFMGANLSIFNKDGVLLPVRDVQRNSLVAFDHGQPVVADARDKGFRVKIDDALKLTTARAQVDGLKVERSYTPENDPMVKFADAARTSAYMSDVVDSTDASLRGAETMVGLANGAAASATTGDQAAAAAQMQATANAVYGQAASASNTAQSFSRMEAIDTLATSNRLTSELGAEMFDALNVSFDLSTPQPLNKPYLVVVMRYRADKDRPETANVWVYAERLPATDEHPRHFLIRRGGFPPGYHIENCQLFLYDGGREVATNVSRKRVDLTTEEAFDYYVIEYVGTHAGQSNPPAKAAAFWPADLHSRLLPDKLTRTIYVRVGKDGAALGLFEDEKCVRPVSDAELTALTPVLRFLPALQKGKPVEGVAAVKLGNASG